MRKAVLLLMALGCAALCPGGGAMAAELYIDGPPPPERTTGSTITCGDVPGSSAPSLPAQILEHLVVPKEVSLEEEMEKRGGATVNRGPIAVDLNKVVPSLEESVVFCGTLAYDFNLNNELKFWVVDRPTKGHLDMYPIHDIYKTGEVDRDLSCGVRKKAGEYPALICYHKVRYTPNTDPEQGPVFDGSDSFMYGVTGKEKRSNTSTVTITYKPSKKPVSADDYAEVTEGSPVTIDVLANDMDPEGGELAVDSIVDLWTSARIVINADNTITYTPNGPHRNGEDMFRYMAVNDAGRYSTATVTVTITPEPEQELPPPPPDQPWWKWWK